MDSQPERPPEVPGFADLLLLGAGGAGRVFQARDLACARTVAIKVLPAPSSPVLAERFQREIRVAAGLSHPNLVPVYTAGTTRDGCLFYAMELVQGPTLLQAGQGLGLKARVRVVAKLARAVAHVHARGVVHRDVKPANVVIDARGEPRLLDFGLAKVLGQPSVTSEGRLIGTPCYMAPELARGQAREATPATDVHGLGVVLYELLAGQPPHAQVMDVPLTEALRRIGQEPPPAPSSLGSASGRGEPVPPGLEAICMRALDPDPALRPRSAAALAEELERWLEKGEAGVQAVGSRRRALIVLGIVSAIGLAATAAWALLEVTS